MNRRVVTTLPNGKLAVITLSMLATKHGGGRASSTPADEVKYREFALSKTLFELYRPWLTNPALGGDELEEWRNNLHYRDYAGPIPLVAHEIMDTDLPVSRANRNNWSMGPMVGGKMTIIE